MKKITKVLALFALSSTMLVGCKNKDNQGSGEQSGETSGEPVVVKDWSDAQKELMSSHLHGIVLPFLDKEGVNVEWDADTSTLVVEGPQMALADTAAYASLFKASEGWDGGDDSEDWHEDADSGMHYYFEKFVSTSAGKRGISVSFGLFNSDDDLVDNGEFYLEAYDDFLYEWPDEAAEDYAASFYPAETPAADMDFAPAFTGGYIYDYSDSAKAVFAQVEEAPDEDHLDCGYSAVLTAAGWNVKEGRDAYGYFCAVSPDSKYQLSYLYRTSRGNFAVYFEETASPTWPAEKISAYLDDGGVATLPALEKAESGWSYQWNGENDGYGWVAVFGADLEALQGYYTTLLGAGFTAVDETSNESQQRVRAAKTFSTGVLNVYAYFSDNPSSVIIGVALNSAPVWPADTLDALYEGHTDVIPNLFTIEAVNGKVFGASYYGSYKQLSVNLLDPAQVTAVSTAMKNYLVNTLHWGVVEDSGMFGNFYKSPNTEIVIQFYEGEASYGYLSIMFKTAADLPAAEWPTDAVATVARSTLGDVVPALDGADSYQGPTQNGSYPVYFVECTFASADAASTAMSTYITGLGTAGWTDSGSGVYYTTNHDVGLRVMDGNTWYGEESGYENMVVILIYQAPLRAWPATAVAEFAGSPAHDVVPALNGGVTYTEPARYGLNSGYVVVEFADAAAAATALEGYQAAITAAGFTEVDEGGFAWSANGELGIFAANYGTFTGGEADERVVVFFKWSAIRWFDVSEYVKSYYSSSASLPSPTGTPVSFNAGVQSSGHITIAVTYATADEASAAAEAFGSVLIAAGFQYVSQYDCYTADGIYDVYAIQANENVLYIGIEAW